MTISRLVVVVCVAGALPGCQDVKTAFGGGKLTPDEFAVMPKAPLVMPPDYNLRPPMPGSRAANMPDPSEQARANLYPNNPEAVAQTLGTGFSDGEKLLLAYAHAANADPSIRQRIAAEEGQTKRAAVLPTRSCSGKRLWPRQQPHRWTRRRKPNACARRKPQATRPPRTLETRHKAPLRNRKIISRCCVFMRWRRRSS